ncbi:unnamed protein product [Echinostoma caproni]|uniref:dolichyl-P-Man:Man5GlcNAc2-PP-dolichol alpha-1,3-mannosyltransferase n=1 Tax=Echinostoma caproni TaxID=27848 RepID=A0A183B4Z5_9TREM|nr:unnamed protein product [Echinostoma caproni]
MVLTRAMEYVKSLIFTKKGYSPTIFILIVAELILCPAIIEKVKYTEIDWVAYMQEVEHFLNGTLDYDQIEGQTGPCVPCWFLVHIFTFAQNNRCRFQHSIRPIRFYIFVPPYALAFMCIISYRIHSIYVLRLFNDPFAILAVYASINALIYGKFTLASIFMSLGVSIKMNVLLFFPGLLLVLLFHRGILQTIGHLCECGILILGAPFLFHNPEAYVTRAFNFGRQFMYKWTVNWRIVPEHVFLDRRFHLVLLALQLIFLAVMLFRFIRLGWSRPQPHPDRGSNRERK